MKLDKNVIEALADQMVDQNYHNAAETKRWLKSQLKKITPNAADRMGMVLWAGGMALKQDDYCKHEAEVIWRHNQLVALSILRYETGVGDEGNPLHAGLHLSPKCPCCKREELQRN